MPFTSLLTIFQPLALERQLSDLNHIRERRPRIRIVTNSGAMKSVPKRSMRGIAVEFMGVNPAEVGP
jgi:hypothetical protein